MTTVARWFTALTLMLVGTVGLVAAPAGAQELSDILPEIQENLELTDEQTKQVGEALSKFVTELDATTAAHDESEEPDPQAMLKDIKKIRNAYKSDLKKILTKEQFAAYEKLMEDIFKEILAEVAELRLTDLQVDLELSDEQVAGLKPVMGDGLYSVLKVIYENGDKRMGVRTKLKIANQLKKIKKSTEQEVKAIMTEEQFQAWQAMKEADKAASKG